MNPLTTAFANLLESLANATLDLDITARQRLQAHNGRVVAVVVEPPALASAFMVDMPPACFILQVTDATVRVLSESDPHGFDHANAVVSGNLLDLSRALITREASPGVRIDGDETAVAELRAVFSELRPDPSAPLGNLFGPAAAENLLGAAEMGMAALRSAASGLSSALADSAAGHFVVEDHLEQLQHGTEELRLRIDRLAARVLHAERRSSE
jgi:ubiquinone biosynthesis protein UbiJ